MNQGIKASVSGIRGILGESLTPPVILYYAEGFAAWTKSGRVALGRDTRPHGPLVQSLIEAVLLAAGIDVIDLGVVPTPTLLHYVRKNQLDGGIVITASHNPIEWNALKLVKRGGIFLNQGDFNELNRILETGLPPGLYKPVTMVGRKSSSADAISSHIETIKKGGDLSPIIRRGFKVGLDPVNGAGTEMGKAFLSELGCEFFLVYGDQPGNFTRPPEPVAAALEDLGALVRAEGCDLGLAFDPDADRLCLVDETGTPLSEELTLALAAWAWLLPEHPHQGPAQGEVQTLIANLSTSRMIGDIARHFGHKFEHSKVGEANVLEAMQKTRAWIGGEGNGGVILPRLNPCRDPFVGTYLILRLLGLTGLTLSEAVSRLLSEISHPYLMIKEKFSVEGEIAPILTKVREACMSFFSAEAPTPTEIDGLRIDLTDSWIHLRASNTEPVVRLIVEAGSAARARELVNFVREIIG